MKNVFISLLNFNNPAATDQCLESIEKTNKNNLIVSVVVIDNASLIQYKNERPYKTFSYHFLRNNINSGFSGGQNKGMHYAIEHGADYVIVLNNDTILDKEFLVNITDAAEKEKKAGLFSPKIYFSKGYEFHKTRYSEEEKGHVIWYAGGKFDWNSVIGKHIGVDEVDTGQFNKIFETDFATGCCVLIKKEVIEKVGYFDERYFLYYEDADFSERVKKNGFSILFVPNAKLWHKNADASGGSGSHLQDYFISRNRLLFGTTYGTKKIKAALLKESARLLFKGRKWQKKGIRDFILRKFGQGSYDV